MSRPHEEPDPPRRPRARLDGPVRGEQAAFELLVAVDDPADIGAFGVVAAGEEAAFEAGYDQVAKLAARDWEVRGGQIDSSLKSGAAAEAYRAWEAVPLGVREGLSKRFPLLVCPVRKIFFGTIISY